jgi:hypothetical protein
MSEEESKGYEVTDKRKVKMDESGEAQIDPTVDESAASDVQNETDTEEMPEVDVYSMLQYFIGMLSMSAWQWLGLVKNPVTDKLTQDLAQAKVAIDSIGALLNQLEGKFSAKDMAELRGMLSDLQINFVQQSNKAE